MYTILLCIVYKSDTNRVLHISMDYKILCMYIYVYVHYVYIHYTGTIFIPINCMHNNIMHVCMPLPSTN